MKVSLLIFAVTLTSITSWAGDKIGNGGDAVICRNSAGQITSARLLDYYEARELRKIPVDLGAVNDPVEKKIDLVLSRLRRLDPARADQYKKYLDLFKTESIILNDADLVDIPDSEHISVPKNCRIEQAAIHKEPMIAGDPRYFLSKEIWDALDETNKAGLILHEVIYRLFTEKGDVNSIKARYFHSVLASKEIETWELGQYADFLKKLELNFIDNILEYQGYRFLIGFLQYYPNGKIHGGRLYQRTWEKPDKSLGNYVLRFAEKSFLSVIPQAIFFNEKGQVIEIDPVNLYFYGHLGIEVTQGGPRVPCSYKETLLFYGETFNLRRCLALPHGKYLPPVPFPQYQDIYSSYGVQGKEIFIDEGPVEFYEAGALKEAVIKINVELKNQRGLMKKYKGKVSFDENGLVID